MRRKTAAAAAAATVGLATIGGIGIGSALMTSAVAETPTAIPAAATEDGTPEDPVAPDAPDDAPDSAPEATDRRAERITQALAGLVEAGTITQEQADAVAETLSTADGLGGPGGPGGPGGAFGVLHEGLETAATTLGLTTDELRTQLEDGSTLGEVADAQGVDRAALVDALVAFAQTEVAERVAAGDLTQERADEITTDLETRVTESLDRALPAGGPGGPGGHGPGGGGPDGSTDDSSTDGDA